jgi:hypothetical protein
MARRTPKKERGVKLCRKRVVISSTPKFLLGHPSIPTTEQYLGAEQDFIFAVNGNLGLKR